MSRPLVGLVCGVVLLTAGCNGAQVDRGAEAGAAAALDVPSGAQRAVVERVVDGDTLWVRVDEPGGALKAGTTHKIRLLEVDAPETQTPGAECGGAEATGYAERELLVGSTVHLVRDREDRDRYDRALRYLWTDDGQFFNLELVRRGLATAVLFEPNDAYIELLRAAEVEARDARRGIFGDLC